jgi:hypothetical protein
MPVFECARCNEMTYSASAGAVGACPRCGSERHRVIEGDFDQARRTLRALGEGDHATLVYEEPAAIAPFCARFLTDGVNTGERVIAAVQDDLREAICALLGPEVELTVEWEDSHSLYGDFDPHRVTATYEAMVTSADRTTRILAGLDGESARSVDRSTLDRYETLAHRVVTEHGATVICAYDARVLPPELLGVGACRHGLAIEDGAIRRNERFEYQPA